MTITLRGAKGSRLTHAELDANFTDLQSADTAAAAALAASSGSSLVGFIQSGTGPATQTVQGKLRRVKELGDRENVDDTGATSILTQFQNAVDDVSTGGRLIVRKGRYKFTITGDSDTILLPSDFKLECEEGVIFEWDYMGSPLFAAVEQENVLIEGPMFEWNGTLVDVSGTGSTRFDWNFSLPNRDFCAHVLSLGSTGVRVRHAGCRVKGDNPTLATEAFYQFASFHHADDGSTRTADNAVENCKLDDVVIGTLFSGQDNFTFKGVSSRRYPGDHPVGGGSGLAGHLLYATQGGTSSTLTSRGPTIKDVVDLGGTFGTITSRLDTTVQLKSCEDSILGGLVSKRPGGMLSGGEMLGGVFSDMTWRPTVAPETNGISTSVVNGTHAEDAIFKGMSFYLPTSSDKAAWNGTFNRCVLDAYISAAHTTVSINSSIMSGGADNAIRIDYVARNSTTAIACKLTSSTLRNRVDITPIGASAKVRVSADSGCEDNVVRIRDTPIHAWAANWTETDADLTVNGFEGIKKSKVFRIAGGAQTNPTTTFQLPRAGVWMGTCQLLSASGGDILGGFYRIVWDTGSLQSVELIGTEWTVGASAPTVLGLAVSNAGVVTVTSTAGSASWDLQYDFESRGNNRYADF